MSKEIRQKVHEEIESRKWEWQIPEYLGGGVKHLGKAWHERLTKKQAGEPIDLPDYTYTLEEFYGMPKSRHADVKHLKAFMGLSLMDYGYNKRCVCGSEHHEPLVESSRGNYYSGSSAWELICPEGHDALSKQEMIDLSDYSETAFDESGDLYYMMKAYEDLLGRVSYLNQVPEYIDDMQFAHFMRANEVLRRRKEWVPYSMDEGSLGRLLGAPIIPTRWDVWHKENDIIKYKEEE